MSKTEGYEAMPAISWSEMLDRISEAVTSMGSQGDIQENEKQQVLRLLESYKSQGHDFREFVSFSSDLYTRNLVTEIGDKLANVIVMCWGPGQGSTFHAHEGSRCFVKILWGELQEERMAHPGARSHRDPDNQEEPNRAKQTSVLQVNQVTYIDDSIGCHRVTNKSKSTPAVTLHVYTPPYRKCRIFQRETFYGEESPSRGPSIAMSRSAVVDVIFHKT